MSKARLIMDNLIRMIAKKIMSSLYFFLVLAVIMSADQEENAPSCGICFEALLCPDPVKLDCLCSARYHQICIDHWLANKMTCPSCRKSLATQEQEEGDDEDEHRHHQLIYSQSRPCVR